MTLASHRGLVERDREWALISDFLDGAPGGALSIEGAAGAGKTVLWRAGVDRARQLGHTVLAAGAAESEATLPYATLHAMVHAVPGEVFDRLAGTHRTVIESVVLHRSAAGPFSNLRLPAALLALVAELAGRAPVTLALDDLQWADGPSARALAFVLRRLAGTPVRLLTTARTLDGSATGPGEAREALQPVLDRRVQLPPLSAASIGAIVERHLGRPPRPAGLRRIVEHSRGNPLFALELTRVLTAGRDLAPGQVVPLPADIGDALRFRVRPLSAGCRELLLVLAADDRAQRAVPDEWEDVLAEAVDQDVLVLDGDEVRFSHPLLRAVLYGDATPARRRRAHQRVAETAPDPARRLVHRALGTAAPDDALAAELEDAAVAARERGQLDLAATLAEHSWRHTPDTAAAYARRGNLAGELLATTGNVVRSSRLLEELRARLPAGPGRAGALWLLAELSAEGESARALHEQALAEAGDDPALLSRIHALYGESFGFGDDVRTWEEHARASLAAAERSGDPGLVTSALVRLGFASMAVGRAPDRSALDRARLLHRPELVVFLNETPDMLDAVHLLQADRLDDARVVLTRLRRTAEATGDLPGLGSALFRLVELEVAAGRATPARTYADEITRLVGDADLDSWTRSVLEARASVTAHFGNQEEAHATAAAAFGQATAAQDGYTRLRAGATLGWITLDRGDPAAARDHLRPLVDTADRMGAGNPVEQPVRRPLVQALIVLGELDEAEEHLDLLARQAGVLGAPAVLADCRRLRGELLAGRGRVAEALGETAAAVGLLRELPRPYLLAVALRSHGRQLRRSRRKAEAKSALESARDTFEQVGAAHQVAATVAEIARVGLRSGPDRETAATEREVAQLAARGLKTQAIASRLSLSTKTVEAHLTRAYRRHGVRSRTELARLFAGSAPAPPAEPRDPDRS